MVRLQNTPFHLSMLLLLLSCLITPASTTPTAFWLMLLSLTALGILLLQKVHQNESLLVSQLAWLPALSVLFTILVLIPLPEGLHRLLSPDSSADLHAAGELLGRSSFPHTVSLLSFKTSQRLLQLITALALFITLSDAMKRKESKTSMFIWVVAMSFIVFLTALGHNLLGAGKIWGTYLTGGGFFWAPLINPNNLARLFGVLSLLSIAGVTLANIKLRPWLVSSAILSGISVYLTQSRWGIIAFTFCLLFAIKSRRLTWTVLGLSIFAGAGLIFTEMASLQSTQNYWAKLELLGQFPELMKHHWITGIGPGSLRVEFHKWIPPNFATKNILFTSQYIITYLENSTLQLFLDHGAVLGLILAFFALWTFQRTWMFAPELAWVLFFLWIADFSDFSIENSAVLFLSILVLALVTPNKIYKLPISTSTGGLAILSVIGTMVTPYWIITTPNYLDAKMSYGQAIKALNHNNKEQAIHWLRFSTHRRPTFYEAHLILARLTNDFNEYKLAVSAKPSSFSELLEETGRPDLMPIETIDGLKTLLDYAFRHNNPILATQTLTKLIENQPIDNEQALWLAQTRVLQQGLEATLDETSEWPKSLNKPCPFVRWRMESLYRLSRSSQALTELESTRDCLDNPDLLKADLYIQQKQPAKAMPIVRMLLRADPENQGLKSRLDGLESELTRALEH